MCIRPKCGSVLTIKFGCAVLAPGHYNEYLSVKADLTILAGRF